MQEIISSIVKTSGKTIQYFLHGGCLIFAKELQKIVGGEIRYLTTEAHIVLEKDGKLYDATGNVTKQYSFCRHISEKELYKRQKLLNELLG